MKSFMFGRCLWTETPPHKKVGRHKSQKTNGWNQKITPNHEKEHHLNQTLHLVVLPCFNFLFACHVYQGCVSKIAPEISTSQPPMRRGINSTTGTFSLAIDDGPFEEFFDDIPLSHWDPDDSIELGDELRVGWLGWLVVLFGCWTWGVQKW